MHSVAQIIHRRRQRRQRSGPGAPVLGGAAVLVLVVGLIGLVIIVAGAAGLNLYLSVARAVPDQPGAPRLAVGGQPSLLLDREGKRILYQIADRPAGESAWLSLPELPPAVWQATVAIEDGRFFERPGFTLPALVNALWDALIFGQMSLHDPILEYLTQQVIMPLSELPASHPDRAYTDTILIMELRRRYSRQELLTWYLNTALYGNGAYGIDAAARLYLGKSATGLTLSEAALLAGIPAQPLANPFDQPDAAFERQKLVLDSMAAYAFIGPDQAQAAAIRLEVSRPLAPTDVVAPHYALAARRQAELILRDAGYDGARLVAEGGLRITTTLDLELQYQVECALRTHITRLSGVDPAFVYATAIGDPCVAAAYLPPMRPEDIGLAHGVTNGAAVVIDSATGEVLAYVGSVDYWNEGLGGALDSAARAYEAGSMLRPYIYLTALSQGYTAATMTLDVPLTIGEASAPLEVANRNGIHAGPISLREALIRDATPPAAQVMNLVGAPNVVRTAHSMGLTTLRDSPSSYDSSLAVTGGEATLLDLTYSFSVLANGGHMVGTRVPVELEAPGFRALDPVMVLQITDAQGAVLWSYEPQHRDTLDPALAYLMNHMLSDRGLRARVFGASNVYDIGRPAGVYAGLAADGRDLWAVGYTPQRSVGVWLGNVDRSPTVGLDAGNGPASLWYAILRYTVERDGLPVVDWPRPATIVEQQVCAISGLLPTRYCPVVTEVFAQGTQPVRQDTYYQMVEVNRQNGRRATASTPRDLVEQRVYFTYPPEAQAWAAAQGIQGPPEEYDVVGLPPILGPVAILEPDPLAYVRGVVEVRGNATLPNFEYYQLAYGAGLNPTDWTQIGERVYIPARGALLGQWDTTGLEGLYSLRLTVVAADQAVQESIIQVTVDNTPPQVSITVPEGGAEIRVSGLNPVLELGVAYADNVGVTQVVYYFDGEPIATASEAPFRASFVLDALGSHSVWAEAFDAAGNSVLSERVSFTVRRDLD
ncbi:MAG: penicillin-binding protein [Anaerolineae bacterium]|nr:penicillin-binding protein [Anaerolineae bacterium]